MRKPNYLKNALKKDYVWERSITLQEHSCILLDPCRNYFFYYLVHVNTFYYLVDTLHIPIN